MFDIRIIGATVLETTSEFDVKMKIQQLIENGTDESDISLYLGDRQLDWRWRAEVLIDW